METTVLITIILIFVVVWLVLLSVTLLLMAPLLSSVAQEVWDLQHPSRGNADRRVAHQSREGARPKTSYTVLRRVSRTVEQRSLATERRRQET